MSPKLQGSISPTFLRPAFMHADPKSVKIEPSCYHLFVLLESGHVKVSCRINVDEIDPRLHKADYVNH